MSNSEFDEQEPLSQSLRTTGHDGSKTNAVRVFVAVAAEERTFADELNMHLSSWKRRGLLQVWHRGELKAGEHRIDKVRERLVGAHIFVILVSPALMSSQDLIEDVDFAMMRHQLEEVPVLPVLLEAYNLGAEELRFLQPLPSSGEPIAQRADRNTAWVEIVQAIQHEAERIQRYLSGPSKSGAYELRLKKERDPNDEPSIDKSG